MRTLALFLLLTAAGCGGDAGKAPVDRPNPSGAAEELVAAYLRNNSADPRSVKFLRWGPHMSPGEWVALWKEAGEAPPAPETTLIRVRFQSILPGMGTESQTCDGVFSVQGKLVGVVMYQGVDDNWKATFRRTLGKQFPGIKVDR